MIIYNLPGSIKPSEVSYRLVTTQSVNRSPFTGHETIYEYNNKYWEILVTYPVMLEYQAKEFDSVFSAINNKKDLLRYNISTLDNGYKTRSVNQDTAKDAEQARPSIIFTQIDGTEVQLFPWSNDDADIPQYTATSNIGNAWVYRSNLYTHPTHGDGYWYCYPYNNNDDTTNVQWYIDFGLSSTLNGLSSLDGGVGYEADSPISITPPLGTYGNVQPYILRDGLEDIGATHTGRIISNNGNLYKVTNVTGGGDDWNYIGERGAAHLFPPKKSTWVSGNEQSINPFGYFTIADDFEWDYNQAIRTQISIPLKEYIGSGENTYSANDNLYELSASDFGGYYFYGNDGTNGLGYYYPLFLSEGQAQTYTTHEGEQGAGTAHTHVFNEAPNVTFYMPDGLDADQVGQGESAIETESIVTTSEILPLTVNQNKSFKNRYIESTGAVYVFSTGFYIQVPDTATQIVIKGSSTEGGTFTTRATYNQAYLDANKRLLKFTINDPYSDYYYLNFANNDSNWSGDNFLKYEMTETKSLEKYHTRHYLSSDTVEYNTGSNKQVRAFNRTVCRNKNIMGGRDVFTSIQGADEPVESGGGGY